MRFVASEAHPQSAPLVRILPNGSDQQAQMPLAPLASPFRHADNAAPISVDTDLGVSKANNGGSSDLSVAKAGAATDMFSREEMSADFSSAQSIIVKLKVRRLSCGVCYRLRQHMKFHM